MGELEEAKAKAAAAYNAASDYFDHPVSSAAIHGCRAIATNVVYAVATK